MKVPRPIEVEHVYVRTGLGMGSIKTKPSEMEARSWWRRFLGRPPK